MFKGVLACAWPVTIKQLIGKQIGVRRNSMEAIRRQARLTFGEEAGDDFEGNLRRLRSLMSALRASDVSLDESLLEAAGPGAAPVTYVEILEDPDFTVSMFVLRPGSKLPLHDHPAMHGVCKVVHGTVRIVSYSLVSEPGDRGVLASKDPELLMTAADPAVLLTPVLGNIHEIGAFGGPAAFVDVLAPPYDTYASGRGLRPCHYYCEREPSVKPGSITELIRTNGAPGYWTDCAPYLGL